jgi:SAM-dependent methyltransferase
VPVSGTAAIEVDAAREEAELKAYLGEDYSREKLENFQREIDREVAEVADEDRFYRTSQAYLYDLTVFAMSATKVPYLRRLSSLLPPGARILDYGCGIGSDGMLLLESGYQVEFADFDNPSTRYLRWRLDHRGLSAPIHDVEGDVPGGFDAAYSFDVLEHVKDPFGFLANLEKRAGLVMVNLLEFDPNEQELHYPLPMRALLRHVASRDLVAYDFLHGSSHLVAYRPNLVSPVQRARNAVRIAAEHRGRQFRSRLARI